MSYTLHPGSFKIIFSERRLFLGKSILFLRATILNLQVTRYQNITIFVLALHFQVPIFNSIVSTDERHVFNCVKQFERQTIKFMSAKKKQQFRISSVWKITPYHILSFQNPFFSWKNVSTLLA